MSHAAHAIHPAIVKRLNRAAGHLHSIVGSIEEERACLDIVQQLQAVEKAVASARRELINDHIDDCLADAEGPEQAMEQFRALSQYW